MPGLHNARNAALAAVAALVAGAPFAAAVSALARFAGVPRRFEFRGEAHGVTFVDDYAHLPGEVRSVLAAARAGGWQRVVAVFQPHRYSRTAALAASSGPPSPTPTWWWSPTSTAPATPPARGLGPPDRRRGGCRRSGQPVHYAPSRSELREVVGSLLRPATCAAPWGRAT